MSAVFRRFASNMASKAPMRIGYVPEHFSTPLYFAKKHYGLSAELIPFPSGTGHMITSLRSNEIDVGIGLTEGWIAGLGKKPGQEKAEGGYKLVGTYVETPLCWAISTGSKRSDVTDVNSLKGGKCGVSRIGSGSYVMAYVLADKNNWLSTSTPAEPFSFVPLQTFAKLREGVNDGTADFFMWEHFTSKRYYDNGEIRRVGEIYTPWSSWKIVAGDPSDPRLAGELFPKLNEGIRHFEAHRDEAVDYISTELDYSRDDATAWLATVRFANDVNGVSKKVVEDTVNTLRKAGVLEGNPGDEGVRQEVEGMVSTFR